MNAFPAIVHLHCVCMPSLIFHAAQDLCFLPRDAMRKRGLCCRPVSVYPSVRPSVCLVTLTDL